MKAHGVFVEETEDGFFVPGNQQYKAADGFVSGDY
jgi:5-enolpyruvylshikimate-3-phosphate synthase